MNYPFRLNQRSIGYRWKRILDDEYGSDDSQRDAFARTAPASSRARDAPAASSGRQPARLPPLAASPRTARVAPAPPTSEDALYEMLLERSQRRTIEFWEARERADVEAAVAALLADAGREGELADVAAAEAHERRAVAREYAWGLELLAAQGRCEGDELTASDALRGCEQREWEELTTREKRERVMIYYRRQDSADAATTDSAGGPSCRCVRDADVPNCRREALSDLVDDVFVNCGFGDYIEEVNASA